ncbi:unnamed protein product [Rotaria magnacalcarata]|uniref:EGF-like domain-containing protein n=2 Tax=Rotaria magnacalcarata TaxID=392030 RepID=A0A816MX02_9BILA|nr:unnamed protein product [Rotaria magnacalcarata]CAF4521420.1 unnamed protein product [Rotaria magnacalcarata]
MVTFSCVYATDFESPNECSNTRSCLNGGLCLHENEIQNPLESVCICQQCFFGNLCQFTTSQYSISLDALIGSMVAIEKRLCLNTITIVLFIVRSKCRSTGCALYIIVLSFLGTCCLIILTLKFISLVLLAYLSNRLSCIFIEYFLKCSPTMVDWLHTCTLLERVWSIQSGLHFDKVKSKKITTVVIPIVIVCVGLTLLHEPLNRESIFDPSPYEGRWSWCMI